MNFIFRSFNKVVNIMSGSGLGRFKPISYVYHVILSKFHPIKTIIHGQEFYLDERDSLSLSVFPDYEPGITKYLSKFVKKGDVVIDVGAHIGYFSVFMSSLVGDSGLVLSYEPLKENFIILQKNHFISGRKNYYLFNKAVLEKNTNGFIYFDEQNSSQHSMVQKTSTKKRIGVVSLDQQIKIKRIKKVNLIKIDVQGVEGQVILGARDIIKNNPDIKIVCEFWPEGLDKSLFNCKKLLELIFMLELKPRLLDEKTGEVKKKICDPSEIINISNKNGYVNLILQKK